MNTTMQRPIMVTRRKLLMVAVLLFAPFKLSADVADELRSVIIAVRVDLLTSTQKQFLREKLHDFTGDYVAPNVGKKWQLWIDGNGNEWHVGWWSVKQFRAAGLTVTLAAVKERLKESQYSDRLKIAVAEWGKAEELITSQGWHRPEATQ